MPFTESKMGCSPVAAGSGITYPSSVRTAPHLIHADLTATADTAAELLRPQTSDSTTARLVEVHPGISRLLVFARYPQASTLTTNPVVRLYGYYGSEELLATAGTILDDGTYWARRIDNVDASAAGITIAIGTTADLRDTTYRYTDNYDNTGFDIRGARWIMALVETAGVISAGTIQLYGIGLNC